MKINPELLGMVVAVSVVAILFGVHYISELIVEVAAPSYDFSSYCQKMNLDC